MIYEIKNDALTIKIDSLGGQVISIKKNDGTEYLWQGDERYWNRCAPNLFPFVGRLTEERYIYDGKSYDMTIHGFLSNAQLSCKYVSGDKIIFTLTAGADTKKIYPFDFSFNLTYGLQANTLVIEYQVVNDDNKDMYFGLGGHPGFRVPLEAGLDFTDFYLEFDDAKLPMKEIFSDTCFVTGNKEPFSLKKGRILPLNHGLFDKDAVVLSGTGRAVTLKSDKTDRAVRVEYPQMPYLGLWHRPKTDAPYICIEPWLSLPAKDNEVIELTRKEDFIRLKSKDTYVNTWSIIIY
jgi:galactose mutarotase-like enzyme